jgi:hypothetical protein
MNQSVRRSSAQALQIDLVDASSTYVNVHIVVPDRLQRRNALVHRRFGVEAVLDADFARVAAEVRCRGTGEGAEIADAKRVVHAQETRVRAQQQTRRRGVVLKS